LFTAMLTPREHVWWALYHRTPVSRVTDPGHRNPLSEHSGRSTFHAGVMGYTWTSVWCTEYYRVGHQPVAESQHWIIDAVCEHRVLWGENPRGAVTAVSRRG